MLFGGLIGESEPLEWGRYDIAKSGGGPFAFGGPRDGFQSGSSSGDHYRGVHGSGERVSRAGDAVEVNAMFRDMADLEGRLGEKAQSALEGMGRGE